MDSDVARFLGSVLGEFERDGSSTTALRVLDLRPRLGAGNGVFASVSVGVTVVAFNVGVFANGQLELVNGHGLARVAGNRWAVVLGDLAGNTFVLYHVNVVFAVTC